MIRVRLYSTGQKPRINLVGIQYLSEGIQRQLFPIEKSNVKVTRKNANLVKLSQTHLQHNDLLGKPTMIKEPIEFTLPKLQGESLDEHFYRIGNYTSSKYLDLAQSLMNIGASLPEKPKKWVFKSGWTRYVKGKKPELVDYPLEDLLVFDVETLYKLSQYPIMATCVSTKAWYGWVSPYLTGDSPTNDHLVPMDTFGNDKLIVGHNISYDRARIAEEYNLKQSNAFFLDTMSLHVAVSGMCSRQRGTWLKYKKGKDKLKAEKEEAKLSGEEDNSLDAIRSLDMKSESLRELVENPVLDTDSESQELKDDPWMKYSSMNSLKHVADLHCGLKLKKEDRDYFAAEDKQVILDNFQLLMNYCGDDVFATFKVFNKIFPEFRELIPHPVSFSALRNIAQSFLPTTKQWETYISTAEQIYVESTSKIEKNLHDMANQIAAMKDDPTRPWENDPWLSQLDWHIDPLKLTKKGLPYKNQKLPGYPNWYKKLVVQNNLKLTTKSRAAPLLLRLSWDSNPLYWIDEYGWCFLVPKDKKLHYEKQNYIHVSAVEKKEPGDEELDIGDPETDLELMMELENDLISTGRPGDDPDLCYFKVPHNDGPNARAVSIMTKSFLVHFEKGILTSEFPLAKDALQLAVSCSYWTSARERIMNQMVVYNDTHPKLDFGTKDTIGMIIPQIIPMGTITRRAVESTWLTASNAKTSRLGSELKSMIKAPPGYCLVGADVDSEELWIASVVGDSVFQMHGGTAIGWMTLEGTKNEGTDLHSKTANILGISRNEAKIFNYGRIYGAGLKFATTLLKKFNPSLTEKEAAEVARKLYSETKGKTGILRDSKIWYGGSESIVFNRLERIAEQDSPRTPTLGAGITAALTKKNLHQNSFLPSRINWAIQSSGVDYLHLLIVSMDYLSKIYNIDARLSVTVHDEIRYLVKIEDKYKAALILQVSNLWTRAMISSQLNINDVPQSCAFFSAVDIDHVLRKEVNLDCITPSNKIPIPHGESIDIEQLLAVPGMKEFFETVTNDLDLSHIAYERITPMIEEIDDQLDKVTKELYLKMQIVKENSQFKLLKSSFEKARKLNLDNKKRLQFVAAEKKLLLAKKLQLLKEISVEKLEQLQNSMEQDLPEKKKETKPKTPGVRLLNKLLKNTTNREYIYQSSPDVTDVEESKLPATSSLRITRKLSFDEMSEAFRT